MNRRFFLLAAPAIVAAPSLMKVSALVMPVERGLVYTLPGYDALTGEPVVIPVIYGTIRLTF